MTIGEVEEFLWTLSRCLEGQIGDWQVRFGGVEVRVRVDPAADQITVSAPLAGSPAQARRRIITPDRTGFERDESGVRTVWTTRLSPLTISELQAGFQDILDRAQRPPGGT